MRTRSRLDSPVHGLLLPLAGLLVLGSGIVWVLAGQVILGAAFIAGVAVALLCSGPSGTWEPARKPGGRED